MPIMERQMDLPKRWIYCPLLRGISSSGCSSKASHLPNVLKESAFVCVPVQQTTTNDSTNCIEIQRRLDIEVNT